MQRRLTIHAELSSFTGYGLHLLEILKGLDARGFFTTVRPIRISEQFGKIPLWAKMKVVNVLQPEPVELMLCPPHVLPQVGREVVYYTMWETTRLPERCVQLLNKASRVIVPCWWCKNNFEASGVEVPISVVPLGHDPEIFYPTPVATSGTCVFGAAGRLAHGSARKGLQGVIECFRRSFIAGEDVRLEVKVHPDCVLPVVTDPRIKIIRQHWSELEVAEWLRGLTCFVSGAAAEGWGLWQHQALASGRPIISTCYAGLLEYFKPGMGWVVDHFELPAREGFAGRGLWGDPHWLGMAAAMRDCYEDRALAPSYGIAAGEAMKECTWSASISALVEAMDNGKDYAPEPEYCKGLKPIWAVGNEWPGVVKKNPLIYNEVANSVSAVICVYQTKTERLNQCLNAVLPYVDQVVLSIDGDGVEPEHVADEKIKPVRNPSGTRIGYGRTANIGAAEVSCDWLLLLNDDVYVNPETVKNMLHAVTRPDIAAVGCLLFYPDGRINHGGIYRNGRNFAHIDHAAMRPSVNDVTEMEAVTLSCALVRRDAFWQIGGFDKQFDCYYEDMDLCLRLREQGWRIAYTPFAWAIHEESQTSNNMGSDFKKQRLAESEPIMIRKWARWFDANAGKRFGTFE